MAPANPRRRPVALLSLLGIVSTLVASGVLNAPTSPSKPTVHETTIPVRDGALADGATLPLHVEGGPELIAFTWGTAAPASFQVRAKDGDGWGAWYAVEGIADEGPDASPSSAPATGYAGPAFLGRDISDIQVRATAGDPTDLVVHAIDSEPASGGSGVASAGIATPPGGIITRAQWGADESWRDDSTGCSGQPDYSDNIKLAVVHHTDGRNDYTAAESASIIRAIYDFHVHTNGWCDVAYNFFVDRFGQTFEGRYGGIRRTAIGGHTSGINSVSTGVAVLGDFTTEAVPAVAYQALVHLLAFKLGFHGVDPQASSSVTIGENSSSKWAAGTTVTLANIEGHGDSNKTSCPGAMLEALLPQLRKDVADEIAAKGYQPALSLGRLSGADRFATAAAIAKSTFGTAASVFLARGDGFADALSANYLAGHGPVPILLTQPGTVPQATLDSIKALGAGTVHLLGGPAAISTEVETSLRLKGLTVDRIAGDDRYGTAAQAARTFGADGIGVDDANRKTAVLSSGLSFADALAAGGLVFGMRFPQLLSDPAALPGATASALTDLGIKHVIITGGTTALSQAVEDQVKALGIVTERVAGATRYETAVSLADLSIDRFGFSPAHVDIATGQSFPDALTGGAHAGNRRAPLILTLRSDLSNAACDFLRRRGGSVTGGHLLGGSSAVDGTAKYEAQECIQPL